MKEITMTARTWPNISIKNDTAKNGDSISYSLNSYEEALRAIIKEEMSNDASNRKTKAELFLDDIVKIHTIFTGLNGEVFMMPLKKLEILVEKADNGFYVLNGAFVKLAVISNFPDYNETWLLSVANIDDVM